MFPVLFAALRPCSCLTKAPARPLWRTAWIVNEHRCIAYRDVMRISGHIGGRADQAGFSTGVWRHERNAAIRLRINTWSSAAVAPFSEGTGASG